MIDHVNGTATAAFTSAAELRHFAKAADAVQSVAAAVSHQIAMLEEEIGARLFNRTDAA